MVRSITPVLLATILLGVTQPLEAQQRSKDSARSRLNGRFDSSAPKIGDTLPDVSGFTADGRPFKLRTLRGQYTVLVFGCLT